jgi:23S rRNA (uracil-5-)-methyltransferase RumA
MDQTEGKGKMAIEITGLNEKFEGSFRFRGKDFSVPYALPNDRVQFLLKRRGRLSIEVRHIEPANGYPETIRLAEPFCDHYRRCGGCRGQHLSYECQLETKTSPVIEKMRAEFAVEPIVLAAEERSAYRNRMDFVVTEECVGLRPAGDFSSFVDIVRCPIQREPMNRTLSILRERIAAFPGIGYSREQNGGIVKYATIRYGTTGALILTVDRNRADHPLYAEYNRFIALLSEELAGSEFALIECETEAGSEISCVPAGRALSGRSDFSITMCGTEFCVPYDSFFQPNPEGFEHLIDFVKGYTGEILPRGGVILDLYCGAGVLSRIIADALREPPGGIIGFDFVESSIILAKRNLSSYHNIDFRAADLNGAIDPAAISGAHLIIADPPRAGLSPALIRSILNDSEAEYFIYISCNPASQIRDLKGLSGKYRPIAAALADCYPQTPHLEQAVILKRV